MPQQLQQDLLERDRLLRPRRGSHQQGHGDGNDGKYLFFQSVRPGSAPGRSFYWVDARIIEALRSTGGERRRSSDANDKPIELVVSVAEDHSLASTTEPGAGTPMSTSPRHDYLL